MKIDLPCFMPEMWEAAMDTPWLLPTGFWAKTKNWLSAEMSLASTTKMGSTLLTKLRLASREEPRIGSYTYVCKN